jgi:hypothetical protein
LSYNNVYNYATVSVSGTSTVATIPTMVHTINLTDTTAGTMTVLNGTAAAAGTAAYIVAGGRQDYLFDMFLPNGLVVVTNANIKGVITYTSV